MSFLHKKSWWLDRPVQGSLGSQRFSSTTTYWYWFPWNLQPNGKTCCHATHFEPSSHNQVAPTSIRHRKCIFHEFLHEVVYMVQPAGFMDKQLPNHDLKQVPRAWSLWLSTFLISVSFLNSRADTSLFYKRTRITSFIIYPYCSNH